MRNAPHRKGRQTSLLNTIALIVIYLSLLLPAQARLRFIGPNPYYSFLTFPQDSRRFTLGSSFSFFYLRNRGWMGHLDLPEISPSPNYVNTAESVEERLDTGLNAQASFQGSWSSPEIMMATYVFEFKSVRVIPLVSAKVDSFSLHSSGTAVPYENPAAAFPFSSRLYQRNSEMSLGLLAAMSVENIPVGVIVNYRQTREGRPSGYLSYTRDGLDSRLNRFNWGWSTVNSCNHIFGTKTNVDAFWEDSYTDSTISQADVVLGADLRDNKLGFRFRQIREYGDEYAYLADVNQYLKDPYKKKAVKNCYRTSNVFKLFDFGGANFYLCTVGEGDFLKQRYSTSGKELMDFYKENSYALELLPIAHFDLDGGGFFRIGTSASFFWKDYGYRDIWGDQEVYSPGWSYFGWEQTWERSSYGNSFSFINFTEADLELPLIDRWNLLLSLDLWSHQVFAYTWRYYGTNVEQGGVFNFVKEAERKNYLRESWFGGTFGLMAGKRLSVGVFLDLPVYYDKYTTTRIEQEGNVFKGQLNAQPAIRKPVTFWALLIMRW